MGASGLKNSRHDTGPYSREGIAQLYRQIARACVFAGLDLQDAEDVAQDIWGWLLRSGNPTLAGTTPWMSAVVHNFILRYQRRRGRHNYREGTALENVPEPQSFEEIPRLDRNEVLERITDVLPKTERMLLTLIRSGYTLAEAGAALGIPKGSRYYFHSRLVEYARRELRRRRSASTNLG